MVDVQISEVDTKLGPASMKFCVLIDFKAQTTSVGPSFCEKQKIRTWRVVEIKN
jgi:hypothetical protein